MTDPMDRASVALRVVRESGRSHGREKPRRASSKTVPIRRNRNARARDSSRLEALWFVTLLLVGATTFLGTSRVAEAAWVVAVLVMVPAMLRTRGWYPKGWNESATGAVAVSIIFFAVAWTANWRIQMTGSEQLLVARAETNPAHVILQLQRKGIDLERELGMGPADVEWILTNADPESRG